MTRLLILLLTVLLALPVSAQSRKEQKQLYQSDTNYEIEMLGVGQDGTKVFKIWSYGKSPETAILHAKELAVRACLFRGLPGSGQTHATPPICIPGAENTYNDFFIGFFTTGGPYLSYVNITNDGMPSGQDRLKMKKGYKIGLKVQILYDRLRKEMEREGTAAKMDSLF